MKTISNAFHWLLSLIAIPFAAFYKAVKAGIIHILKEVDRLFNIVEKDYDMTLEEIGVALTALTAKVDALVAPVTADLTPVLTAIADLKAEVVTKVEGAPPAPVV